MPAHEHIVPELMFNIWDKDMILDVLIGCNINWSFQEGDHADITVGGNFMLSLRI